MNTANVYDQYAQLYVAKGMRPIPIGPGTKKPQAFHQTQKRFVDLPAWGTRDTITLPQPGAGIGVVLVDGMVAIDMDNDEIAIALYDVLPDTDYRKVGARGETCFFYAPGLKSQKFLINGTAVCEILAAGTQTVLPPTIHKDTALPYRWTGTKALLEIEKISELPQLPTDIVEQIAGVLVRFGYKPEPEDGEDGTDDGLSAPADTPLRALNDLALKNLSAWVPDLKLYGCKRRRGPHASYEAVATWRVSSKGRALEEREPNLKISGKGIVDFGDGKKYTPIDLVMAAFAIPFQGAVAYLDEKLGWSAGAPEFAINPAPEPERVKEAPSKEDAPKEAPPKEEPKAEQTTAEEDAKPHTPKNERPPAPPAALGQIWFAGDPIPPGLPMLVPKLVPSRGYGYIGGQWGSFKTFHTVDLAAAVASGGKFAGEQVALKGAVLQLEMEGSENEARLQAALAVRGITSRGLPIAQLKAEPPSILLNGRLNGAFDKWAKVFADYAKTFAKHFDVPLALVTIDPQNRIAGFRDEQSSSEGQIVSNALAGLAAQLGCVVLVVDHFGKDPSAGLRGTSVKETNPLFILNVGETSKELSSKRTLEVRKMRNGDVGIAIEFWMEKTPVTVEQLSEDGEIKSSTIDTLAIHWGGAARKGARNTDSGPTVVEARFLKVLNELISNSGKPLPAGCQAPIGLLGIEIEVWRMKLVSKTILEGKGAAATFGQIRANLLDKGLIDMGEGFVWVPLIVG